MHDKELKTDRLLLLIGLLIFYSWGFIYRFTMPEAKDPSTARLLGCMAIFTILCSSFIIPVVKRNLSFFIYGLSYLLTLHQVWLVSINGITAHFLLLYVVMVLVFKTYFKEVSQLIAYSVYTLLLMALAFKFTPDPSINPYFAFGNLLSLDLLIVPILGRRIIIQRKLDYNRALMKSLYMESADCLFLLNEDLTVRDFNNCARELFIENKDWKGRTIGTFLPLIIEEKIKEKINLAEKERVWHDEFESNLHGKAFWGDITYKPLKASGESLWFVRVADITPHKLTEQQLQDRTKALKRSNVDLEQMAYIASHDLQEPLRTISSFVQLLHRRYDDKLDEEARQFIGYVVEGAERMKHLINDLLTYSRIDVGEGQVTAVDTGNLVNQVLKNLMHLIQESQAEIRVEGDFPKIYGVSFELMELFQNLIANALKFRSPDLKAVIRISAEKEISPSSPAFYRFSVSDNGIGISNEYHQKIFMIFQRLHSRDEYPGTGIGLAICKKIVEKYNGGISVESEPGQGTTFHFTLCENAFKLRSNLKKY